MIKKKKKVIINNMDICIKVIANGFTVNIESYGDDYEGSFYEDARSKRTTYCETKEEVAGFLSAYISDSPL